MSFYYSTIFIFTFFIGFLCLVFFRFHYLVLLIGLELIMVSFLLMFLIVVCFSWGSFDLFILSLVMMVVEGSFGLCVVLNYSRMEGGDYYMSSSYFYLVHEISPFFHSIISPTVKISIIILLDNVIIMLLMFDVNMGRNKAISRSKIRNIIAIIKNWDENGIIDEDFWLNPHSKFIFTCLLLLLFFDAIIKIELRIKVSRAGIVSM